MENKTTNNRRVIASVQNALNILNLFDEFNPELGNGEIASMLSMNPGTVAGQIYTLRLNGYLDQNPANHKYRLGLKLAERANVLLYHLDLRKIAMPYLEDLRDWCGESVNLAILDNKEVVYIERLFGYHALGIRPEVGKRAPIHSTALGKAIAANLSTEQFVQLTKDYKFDAVTPRTITSLTDFTKELDHVRVNHYALDDEENEVGGRCIGAPIFNNKNEPIAAISISCPVQRFPMEQLPDFAQRILNASRSISKELGHTFTAAPQYGFPSKA